MIDPNPNKYITIRLMGDSATGKYSLINRFIYNTFGNQKCIYGTGNLGECDSYVVSIDNKLIKLKIYNSSEYSLYSKYNIKLSNSIYRNIDGIIFVFDINNKKTFENIKNFWINQFKLINTLDTHSIIFVGTKSDIGTSEITIDEINKFISDLTFPNTNNIKYFETSAKNNINVNIAFLELTQNIIADRLQRSIIQQTKKDDMVTQVQNHSFLRKKYVNICNYLQNLFT